MQSQYMNTIFDARIQWIFHGIANKSLEDRFLLGYKAGATFTNMV